MDKHEAREAAADFLGNILISAYDGTSLDEIEQAFEVDTNAAMAILFEIGSATVSVYWDASECSCDNEDPFASVLLGDDDPTADLPENRGVCLARDGNWHCTREEDHPGSHIAGDGFKVCAVWL